LPCGELRGGAPVLIAVIATCEVDGHEDQSDCIGEAQSGGKAVDADADRDGDTVRYTVKVAKADGTTEKVKVNGADGKIASAK
jgi:uncharacterized membrane protein YkoI